MKKIALLFPGSGAQYVGMGRSLYADQAVVRETFEEANDVLHRDISKVILEGSVVKLNQVQNMLVAVYTVSVAYFRAYKQEIGLIPQYMAGHSLGEYSALTCSGVIPFRECLRLLQYRGQLAEEVLDTLGGTMTILKHVDPAKVEEECSRISTEQYPVSIACYNSPRQVLVSGHEEPVRAVEKAVLEENDQAEIINLVTSPPYHSALMKSHAGKLEQALRDLSWGSFQSQVISNVNARPYRSKDDTIDNLSKQLFQPVQWQKSIELMISNGVELFIEMGPQNVMKNIFNEITNEHSIYAFDEKLERHELVQSLSEKHRIKKEKETLRNQRFKAISMCLTHAISTRNNREDGQYDPESLEAYERIKQVKKQFETNDQEISITQVTEAFHMLDLVFNTKQVPVKERDLRLQDILKRSELDENVIELLSH